MAIFNSYVKLPEGNIAMDIAHVIPCIDDLPINGMVILHSCVELPEAKPLFNDG